MTHRAHHLKRVDEESKQVFFQAQGRVVWREKMYQQVVCHVMKKVFQHCP